jgi:hypothetical protein
MKPDLYTKAILTVIAIMLIVLAVKPMLLTDTIHAAGAQYKVVHTSGGFAPEERGRLQKDLDENCGGGLVAAMTTFQDARYNWAGVLICRNSTKP